jgi:hypothetical protein
MLKIIQTTKQIGLLTTALTLALVANFAYGQWADPVDTPPEANIAAPINTSAEVQTKTGDLGAGRMLSNQYCDSAGGNCFAPTGSGPSSAGANGRPVYEMNVMRASKEGWNAFTSVSFPSSVSVSRRDYDACFLTSNDVTLSNDSSYTGAGGCYLRQSSSNWILTAEADKRMTTYCYASCLTFPVIIENPVTCDVQFDYVARSDSGLVVRTITQETPEKTAAIILVQNVSYTIPQVLGSDSWGSSGTGWGFSGTGGTMSVGYMAGQDYEYDYAALSNQVDSSDNYYADTFQLIEGETATIVNEASPATWSKPEIPAGTGSITATVLDCTPLN